MTIILSVSICVLLCVMTSLYITNDVQYRSTITERNEIDFYRAFLYAKEDSSRISIKRLIPVEWDTMKVFRAYATAEDKVKYAGYTYSDKIDDLSLEDALSLLFLRSEKVVYYVDNLRPEWFTYNLLDNGLEEMSLYGWYRVTIDSFVHPDFTRWAYYSQIDEVDFKDDPYFEISYLDSGAMSLVLNCD
jgi:hypothetical protein